MQLCNAQYLYALLILLALICTITFVNFLGKQDGLVHISQLAAKRVQKVTDVVKEGDEVSVKVIGFDRGKVKLSIKEAV